MLRRIFQGYLFLVGLVDLEYVIGEEDPELAFEELKNPDEALEDWLDEDE